MPRNFFNILRDNPESWGGKQNPLTLPTTRRSDKAQKMFCDGEKECRLLPLSSAHYPLLVILQKASFPKGYS